ncbi:DUF6083 domain-containing protein [Streptomyces mirabilis]|uniref:DUF6083 domain-containing protein n=1 Tax=Streptomyces mirabilis TaxID=68239 RepID=UPI0036CFEE70
MPCPTRTSRTTEMNTGPPVSEARGNRGSRPICCPMCWARSGLPGCLRTGRRPSRTAPPLSRRPRHPTALTADRYPTYTQAWVLLEPLRPNLTVPSHIVPPAQRWIIDGNGLAWNTHDGEPTQGAHCRIAHRLVCPGGGAGGPVAVADGDDARERPAWRSGRLTVKGFRSCRTRGESRGDKGGTRPGCRWRACFRQFSDAVPRLPMVRGTGRDGASGRDQEKRDSSRR